MKLLAIDTSTEKASVALKNNDELTELTQDSQKTHAQLVLPMIDQLLVDSGLAINQLDGVIFGCGPGSFTGLRIACSIAKGLAYAHDLALTPVSSLGTIAWKVRQMKNNADLPVLALLDARMQEMYWSYFASGQLIAEEKVCASAQIQIPAGQAVIAAGVGIDQYSINFSEQLKSQISTQLLIYPEAGAMIELALGAAIEPVSVAAAQPVYVRNQVTQGAPRG